MLYYAIAAGVVGLIGFLLLRPRVKVLIAFFVMTSCFDLVPRLIFNKDVWDLGAVLLLIAWLQLAFLKVKTPFHTYSYVALIRIFIVWMFVCLLWSILISDYPALDTLKASRQMIIGFLSFFVFRRLFATDQDAFSFFMKSLYVATFALLPISLVQYFIHRPLLFGLHREYGEIIRSLPVFLPIALLYFWIIVSKLLTADRVAKHELLYAGMVIGVTALTFTRGIYLSVLFVFCTMLITLTINKKLDARATIAFISLSVVCVAILLFGGYGNKVIERFASAIDLAFLDNAKATGHNEDTFTGRLALTKERFELVAEHNPLIGYGFIHENNVPNALRAKLKFGSAISTPEYLEKYRNGHPYVPALHSVDIGWADVVVNTGLLGFSLFLLILGAFIVNYLLNTKAYSLVVYQFRLAFYLQVLALILLMFNGNPFVALVQIPSLMLAGYAYCSLVRPDVRSGDQSTAIAI
jgi:hypothetical protein